MSFKCPICERTFSRRSAYGHHTQACIKKAEMFDEESSDNDDNDDNNENDNIEVQDMSFDSIESTRSELVSEMSTEDTLGLGLDTSESDTLESDALESDILGLEEFPNDAYKDLMILITKNKLSNRAGNDVIQFFNKHSNLAISPLPKNIEKGREFMDNMKISSLEFDKVLITNHNDKDYFLYYQNLMNCVKNILAVPDITKDLALSFKSYKVNILF